jgi:two-component system LytT family response regulator
LLHRESLTAIEARLHPADFVRVHRSHLVRIDAIRELVPRPHGEFRIRLVDGNELTSGRLYRDAVRQALALVG